MKQRGDEAFDSKAGTRVGSPLFLWETPGFSAGRFRKASSIPELLLCLLLWVTLAGAILGSSLPSYMEERKKQIALQEGEYVARWLQRNLIKACIERRAFDIKYYTGRLDAIKIQWYSPPVQEAYKLRGKCWIQFDTQGSVTPRYSPTWHTMTPAVTLKVYTSADKDDIHRPVGKITVSGYCLVSFRETE